MSGQSTTEENLSHKNMGDNSTKRDHVPKVLTTGCLKRMSQLGWITAIVVAAWCPNVGFETGPLPVYRFETTRTRPACTTYKALKSSKKHDSALEVTETRGTVEQCPSKDLGNFKFCFKTPLHRYPQVGQKCEGFYPLIPPRGTLHLDQISLMWHYLN